MGLGDLGHLNCMIVQSFKPSLVHLLEPNPFSALVCLLREHGFSLMRLARCASAVLIAIIAPEAMLIYDLAQLSPTLTCQKREQNHVTYHFIYFLVRIHRINTLLSTHI